MLEKNYVPSFINENDIPDSQAVGCAFRVIFFSSSGDGLTVSHGCSSSIPTSTLPPPQLKDPDLLNGCLVLAPELCDRINNQSVLWPKSGVSVRPQLAAWFSWCSRLKAQSEARE